MTRTSSISGTFVNRQRSPVRVAAAISLRAAFLAPLIGTVPRRARPPSTRKTSRWHRRRAVLPVERARVRPPAALSAVPRTLAVAALGDADAGGAPAGGPRGRRRGRRPRGAALQRPLRLAAGLVRPSRGRSPTAMSAISAITTTLSGRTWRKPPTIANDSSRRPCGSAARRAPSMETSGAWCGQHAELAFASRAATPRPPVAVREPLRRDDLEEERHRHSRELTRS